MQLPFLLKYVLSSSVYMCIELLKKFQVTLYTVSCIFQPKAEIIQVIVNIFSPFNRAECNISVENS